MRPMIPSFEFRRRARQAMKPVMSVLILVALIASLPSLISSAVTLMADADPATLLNTFSDRLTQVVEKHGLTQPPVTGEIVVDKAQLEADVLAVQEAYFADVKTFAKEKGPLVLGLSLMVMIASPVLMLGMINAMLHALRKKEFTAGIALSRARYLFKALGLELLIAVKLFVWMLPGTLLMVLSLFLPPTLTALVAIVGLVATIVMGVRAGYSYSLSVFVLADEPQTRVRDCIRRSREVMQGRRMEMFSLEISFIGWQLLLSMVQSFLLGFGAIIGLTLGMFAALFLDVYTHCAKAAFYQEYAVGPITAPEAEEAPKEDELN